MNNINNNKSIIWNNYNELYNTKLWKRNINETYFKVEWFHNKNQAIRFLNKTPHSEKLIVTIKDTKIYGIRVININDLRVPQSIL